MPAINHKALDTLCSIGLDVLHMKVGEELELQLKDQTIKLRREQ